MTKLDETLTDAPDSFDAPWQVEAYAIGQVLITAGLIPANDWATTLGAMIQQSLDGGAPDNLDTYYAAVAEALDETLGRQGIFSDGEVETRIQAWRSAYERTPHGQPVKLA